MPTSVIMPALELAQETGKVLRWLKAPGDAVVKGEPLVEIETDKVTTEIEAPASGILRELSAQEGDVVPVGQAIALILSAAESGAPSPTTSARASRSVGAPSLAGSGSRPGAIGATSGTGAAPRAGSPAPPIKASPLARKIAEQHGVDLSQVEAAGGVIQKADVLAHIERGKALAGNGAGARLAAASPKARRLAAERRVDVGALRGSGPNGAVLAADVFAAAASAPGVAAAAADAAAPAAAVSAPAPAAPIAPAVPAARAAEGGVGTVWRIMAERMTASWTTAPHFYLFREVNVARLISWRELANKRAGTRITYTDLLVKLVAATLARHPGVNASWKNGSIARNAEINIGLAVAIDDGLVVPVIPRADAATLSEIAARREDVVSRAQASKLRPADIQGGGFTISNLGMYGVDAFSAIVNPPQAAILAVGRIADRVVPVDGRPAVRPTMMLSLSCDHRAIDGARGAQFLGDLADVIEEPLTLLA